MSIGPPALGNVLVQRLDAVLGTSMAAHANLAASSRADAVTPPGEAARPDQSDPSARGPRQPADGVDGGSGRQNTVVDAKTAAALAQAARGVVTRNDFTASAPTTLGLTARTILTLLAMFPEETPPIAGRQALWTPANPSAGQAGGQPGSAAGMPPGTAAGAGTSAGAAGQAGDAMPNPSAGGAPGAAAQPGGPAPGVQGQAAPPGAAGESGARPTGATPGSGAAGATSQAGATVASHAASAPSVAALAQALRQALQQSGLFYESHLTEMVFGRRTPAQLGSEPQANLPAPSSLPTPPEARASAARAAPLPQQAEAGNTGQAGGGPSGASSTGPSSTSVSTSLQSLQGGNPLASIHPDATLLVRQQLDVLANQAVTWQGQAWPGTEMEWEVARDRTATGPEGDDTHWATRIKIDLPRLGLVEARLNLAGNQLVLHLVAPRSSAELSRHGDLLRRRLDAAGLTLSQLNVDALPPSILGLAP